MPYALLFLPALVAITYVVLLTPRERHALEAAVVELPVISGDPDPLAAIDARATLDARDADELDALASQLEVAAVRLERVG